MGAVVLLIVVCVFAFEALRWQRDRREHDRNLRAWDRGYAQGVKCRRAGKGVPPVGGVQVPVSPWLMGNRRRDRLAFNREIAFLDGRLVGWRDEDKRLHVYEQRVYAERGVELLEKWANRR